MRDDFFYANSLEALMTPYDVTLRFMHRKIKAGAKPARGDLKAEDVFDEPDTMSVSMSPMHLKAMVPALVELIHQYEARHGKLALEDQHAALWEKLFSQDKRN
jgi:hypothetical protein